MEYIAYTDESYSSSTRYKSISSFSFSLDHRNKIVSTLKKDLDDSSVKEFKWNKLKDAKYYFCAEKILKWLFRNLYHFSLRVDTITWDTHDSRHAITGRDDKGNYARMFFHLLTNVIKRRSGRNTWHIRADQCGGIDWKTTQECMESVGRRIKAVDTLYGRFFHDQGFTISSFEQCESHKEVPIQICDLFSGMASFLKEDYEKFVQWKLNQNKSLFESDEKIKISNREKKRFELIIWFHHACSQHRLGVSIRSNGCLKTFNCQNPFNFWNYEPQDGYDKAPIKANA